MSRLFTNLKEKAQRLWKTCNYLLICLCVSLCWSCLWSLSPDAAKSPCMCELHFQSSLLGGGSSLILDALAILEGLPVLFRTTTALPSLLASAELSETTIFSVWLYLAAMGWLTCISSHIQSTAQELFPQMLNARTQLHISRPFLQQTERRWIS